MLSFLPVVVVLRVFRVVQCHHTFPQCGFEASACGGLTGSVDRRRFFVNPRPWPEVVSCIGALSWPPARVGFPAPCGPMLRGPPGLPRMWRYLWPCIRSLAFPSFSHRCEVWLPPFPDHRGSPSCRAGGAECLVATPCSNQGLVCQSHSAEPFWG